MTRTVTRRADVRRGAKLTGRAPLRYDRHGDLIFDDEESHDAVTLLGDRWLARREIGGR